MCVAIARDLIYTITIVMKKCLRHVLVLVLAREYVVFMVIIIIIIIIMNNY